MVVCTCARCLKFICAATMTAVNKKRKHSTWVKFKLLNRDRHRYSTLLPELEATDECSRPISGWTSVHSRNNKNPARSLAGLKRFFTHSVSLARARTNEPAANVMHQSRDQVFDKKVEIKAIVVNLHENDPCRIAAAWLEYRTSASARRISRHTPSLSPGVLSTGR